MDAWQTILLALGGNAVLLAVLGYVAKSLLDKVIVRDTKTFEAELKAKSDAAIEQLRNELQLRTIEYQVRFTRLHEKRGEVISELYGRIARAKNLLDSLVELLQPGGQNLREKKKRTADAYSDAYTFLCANRIFIPPETAENAESVLEAIRTTFITFDVSQDGNEEYKPDPTGLWVKSYKAVRDQLPPLFEKLESEFRSILGGFEKPPSP